MFLGPHVGAQHPCMYPPLNYKWEGTQRYKGHAQYNSQIVEVGYYAPAA
jgi:hypothetical protein